MIHKACMPVYMNSGKIVAGRDGTGRVDIEGSTRGPHGPKKGPEKNAPQYPFGRGGWGVKNYLGDALMPGS